MNKNHLDKIYNSLNRIEEIEDKVGIRIERGFFACDFDWVNELDRAEISNSSFDASSEVDGFLNSLELPV